MYAGRTTSYFRRSPAYMSPVPPEFHMSTVRDLLARKPPAVVWVTPQTTVLEAAMIMADNGFGAVLVLDGKALVGIFTERDVLRRVVAVRLDPASTSVESVMTASLLTCVPDTSLDECGAIMTTHRIRHLPVVDASGLLGLVSIGDLLAHQVSEHEVTIRFLNEYMFNAR